MAETPETLVVKQELGHCPRMQGHHTHTGASQGVGEKTWMLVKKCEIVTKVNIWFKLRPSTATPGSARVSFPSPCITSTHQLTDQSSSYPSSPPSPTRSQSQHKPGRRSQEDQTLSLLKQYYLDAILKIDPQHPLGIKKKKVSCIANTCWDYRSYNVTRALPCLTSGMRVRVELIIKVSVRMRSIKG